MPDLHLRVRCGDSIVDVVAAVEPTHTVGELADALADHVGCDRGARLARHGVLLDRSTSADRAGFVCGDGVELVPDGSTLVEPPPSRPYSPPFGTGLTIDVVGGPDSGRSFRVGGPGRHSVGRAGDVRIADPTVSRRHAVVTVDRSGRVTIEPDPTAANGVAVAGVEVTGPRSLGATDVVRLGATRLVVRPLPESANAGDRPFGHIDVHRTPYRPPIVRERVVEPIGPIPERPELRRVQLVGVLAPLAAGVAMYAFTRHLQFLALTLISPVVVVGSAWDDRRSGRRAARNRVAAFRADLGAQRERIARWRDDERGERLVAAPDLADLVRRAELRTIDLWPRGREAPDFLRVRVGLGADAVGFPIELAPGGDDDLRAEAATVLVGLDRLDDVPVLVDLVADPVVAVHGPPLVVDGVAASIVVQAATLHGPDDLVIVGAVAPRRGFEWMRWLPHARSVASPLDGDHVPSTTAGAAAMIDRLIGVAALRASSSASAWPRVLVVLDVELLPDAARVAQLLDEVPSAGLSVVCLAASPATVPRQATCTLAVTTSSSGTMRGLLWSTDPTVADRPLEVEYVRRARAEHAARALAPLRDASSASLASTIPRTVPLLDVLAVGRPSPAWVLEHWERRPVRGLRFPVGAGADGPIEIDLVEDGPHTLVGGTSGSGKSELLQSMVAALAVHHPPTRLNFLFVDYKGGAFARAFDRLPHTVGSVTNLSPELATRALVSLRAELHRRMALLEGRAKDLAELLAVAPDAAPASLVIVVDEFATLAREVPDFVAGVVDLAQRGRSLGIHLVLATQRPSGSVDENILANTNVRIALRLLDRSESSAIVGAPDAADVPVPLRGRGFVRLGARRPIEVQTAYGGAPLRAERVRPPVLVTSFGSTDASPRSLTGIGPVAAGPTQLDAVLDSVGEAARRVGAPPPHRPWHDVLPDVVVLDDVLAAVSDDARADPGRFVTLGLLDVPERQEQRPAVVDLEDGGGLLVFGSGGAGASTLLRTVAASVGGPEGSAVVVAFDPSGRGLGGLRALPHVAAVAGGDDPEAVSRHLLLLDAELDRRRRLLVELGVERVSAVDPVRREALPRIVVLVDGVSELVGSLADDRSAAGDEWFERLVRLVVDGRQVGVHVVATADRRSAVPVRMQAAIGNRLVLRQADEASALDHGVRPGRVRDLAPGRALLDGTSLVQVASVSLDPSPSAQRDALAEWGRRVVAGPAVTRLRSQLTGAVLPDRVGRDTAGSSEGPGIVLGFADVTGCRVDVDLRRVLVTVCGPPGSGRSTALATLAAGAPPDTTVVRAAGADHDLPVALEQVARSSPGTGSSRPVLVVVDDADAVDLPHVASAVEQLMRAGAGVVLAVESRSMTGYSANPLVALARRARRLLVLQPDDLAEFLQATGVRLALRPGLTMPPGRGVLLVDRRPMVVQVAVPSCAPTPQSVR